VGRRALPSNQRRPIPPFGQHSLELSRAACAFLGTAEGAVTLPHPVVYPRIESGAASLASISIERVRLPRTQRRSRSQYVFLRDGGPGTSRIHSPRGQKDSRDRVRDAGDNTSTSTRSTLRAGKPGRGPRPARREGRKGQ